MNSSAVVRLPLSGTISLFQDAFYFIEVEYSSIRSGSFFTSKRLTLQMFQDGLPRSIPSESLFISEHLTGSPIQVTVHPSSQLCASISTQAISSGTIMTAGIHATLSLHAKDVFGNSLSEQHLTHQNVSAIFGGQIAERPRFSYISFSEHTSMNFVLMKKGSCSLQWFARGVPIQEAFHIAVIPNSPDFSSISFTRNFHQFSTAGMFFQQTIYICDNFGNIRSFLEKNHDFSRDIQLHSNHSKSVFHYNVTLCRRNNEYVLFNNASAFFILFLQLRNVRKLRILNTSRRACIGKCIGHTLRRDPDQVRIQFFGFACGVLVTAQRHDYFTCRSLRSKIIGMTIVFEYLSHSLMNCRSLGLD